MPRTSPYRVVLTDEERRRLEAAARRYTSPYRDVVRARIVLYAAEGLGNDEIAARLDTPRQVVSKWRKRFCDQRLAGLGPAAAVREWRRPPTIPWPRGGRRRIPSPPPGRSPAGMVSAAPRQELRQRPSRNAGDSDPSLRACATQLADLAARDAGTGHADVEVEAAESHGR